MQMDVLEWKYRLDDELHKMGFYFVQELSKGEMITCIPQVALEGIALYIGRSTKMQGKFQIYHIEKNEHRFIITSDYDESLPAEIKENVEEMMEKNRVRLLLFYPKFEDWVKAIKKEHN